MVKPGARQESVVRLGEGEYRVSVKAPAREGKANEAVIALLAEYFDTKKSHIIIVRGVSSRKKWVDIGLKSHSSPSC